VFAGLFSASLILLRSSVPADALTQPEWADGATTLLKIALVLTPFAGIASCGSWAWSATRVVTRPWCRTRRLTQKG
jgi:hypothetical protein